MTAFDVLQRHLRLASTHEALDGIALGVKLAIQAGTLTKRQKARLLLDGKSKRLWLSRKRLPLRHEPAKSSRKRFKRKRWTPLEPPPLKRRNNREVASRKRAGAETVIGEVARADARESEAVAFAMSPRAR